MSLRGCAWAAVPLLSTAAFATPLFSPAPADGAHTITGDVRLVSNFQSAILGNSRTVAVYLPPGYETSGARYPVLYMHDGQNLFDAATSSFGHEWGVDEACESLMRSGELPPFIVVGPYNTGDRIAEYTPVADPQYGGGRGDLYGRFLIQELKPFIDSNLRTLPDAAHTGVMGSSLGGLISLYLGMKRPDVFSRVGALSPSLWWAGGELTKTLASSPAPSPRPRVWLDMGASEGGDQTVARMKDLAGALEAQGWRDGDDLAARTIDGGRHDEASWGARTPDVLKFLFPAGAQLLK